MIAMKEMMMANVATAADGKEVNVAALGVIDMPGDMAWSWPSWAVTTATKKAKNTMNRKAIDDLFSLINSRVLDLQQ